MHSTLDRSPYADRAAKVIEALIVDFQETEKIEAIIADFQATEKALAAEATGPLPGGYAVGEKVFMLGPSYTYEDGDKDTHGQAGEVTRRSTSGRGKGVAVKFPGNKANICCPLTTLSRTPPPPLPGGYAVGEKVYFTNSMTFGRGTPVSYGQAGEVAGHLESNDPDFGKSLLVIGHIPVRNAFVHCELNDISRAPPPPLPGGYVVGEKVYYTGSSHTFSVPKGLYKVKHGQAGEVQGPSMGELGDKGVDVMFKGNTGNIECRLTELSRARPPPLPGGYAVGENVYFTGPSMTWDDGDKLTHGQRGEVTGHPASHMPQFGKGVTVMFPGNKTSLACDLTDLSRTWPPPGGSGEDKETTPSRREDQRRRLRRQLELKRRQGRR